MSVALPIRCEDCARDVGRSAPTLVVCIYQTALLWADGGRDRWSLLALGERIPTRAANTPPPPRVVDGVMRVPAWISGRTRDQDNPGGRSVSLACRRCKRSGWRRRQKLYAVAEQARAGGASVAYLSLG